MARKIIIGEKTITIDKNVDGKHIRDLLNIDKNHFLGLQNDNGKGYEIIDDEKQLPQKRILNMIPLPRYKQGYNYRKERILQELGIISKRYPVQIDDEYLDYISVMKFPLNKYWSQFITTLLVKIPDQYPQVAPVHFYMKNSLTYKGRCPSHYFPDYSEDEMSELGWGEYCLHIDENWIPSANILDGDSLISYLELVKLVLDNPEKEEV